MTPNNDDQAPMMVKLDWKESGKPLKVHSSLGKKMRVDLSHIPLWRTGTFLFTDGTTQGWTLDQVYDTSSQKQLTIVSGFTLGNSQKLALAASACPLTVMENVGQCDIYFESPDLVQNAHWQQIAGYSLSLQANFCSPCYDISAPGLFFVQLQLVTIDGSGTPHLFAEVDPATKKFLLHPVSLSKQHDLTWKPNLFADPQYKGHKVKQLRVRCTTPHITGLGAYECGVCGKWLIGNVSPEK